MSRFDSAKRGCIALLQQIGIAIHDEPGHYSSAEVLAFQYTSDEQRLTAWYAESLLHGLICCERGEWTIALRCYVQAAEYRARLNFNDYANRTESAVYELRNQLERVTNASTVRPQCQISWINCCGEPTPDTNEAIGFAVLNRDGKKFPICGKHRAMLNQSHSQEGCRHPSAGTTWSFEPFEAKP